MQNNNNNASIQTTGSPCVRQVRSSAQRVASPWPQKIGTPVCLVFEKFGNCGAVIHFKDRLIILC